MKFLKSLFASANVFALNSAAAKSFTEAWPQIKSYYDVLSKSFHASEKGNLNEIKSHSAILVEKAEELSIEGMPAEYRNPKILETLLNLKKQTKVVNYLVQENVMDAEIKLALTKLNEIFHQIVELCLSEK
ncbi:MAG: hypothetical protein M0D53_13625 [Flavobacterium sp. JAD_PAG50586_2]|nr:MAG: hypothetical protein M0D53_13625 [Flavobacterium sp. JAD_PAG50586_2]